MQRNDLIIQPYRPELDAVAVYSLWQENLAQLWPIDLTRMQAVLAANNPEHFVARIGEQIVGFVATGTFLHNEQKIGQLELLLVSPQHQRQGIGALLHATTLDLFRQAGIHRVLLGAISPRFWFAVPANLPNAVAFFAHQGWDLSRPVYDLIHSLKDFTLPEKIRLRMVQEEISIGPASPDQIGEIVAFEEKEFSDWSRYFKDYAALGDAQDLLIARDKDQKIVGSLVMLSPQSHAQRPEFLWKRLLGPDMGAMMAVGVAEAERGRGIGIALVAVGGALLRERGTDACLIDWVVINDFYAKLGWETWREYYESWREL